MDDSQLPSDEHRRALDGLRRLNRASNTSAIMWSQLRRCMQHCRLDAARVLDVAAGGGDIALGIAWRAQQAGVKLDVLAGDISATALEVAAQRAADSGLSIECVRFDAMSDDWPDDIDIVINSLFLHHLDDASAVRFLQRAAGNAQRALIISDLRRTRAGLWLARAGSRLLSRSAVVHHDALQSVRAAFTLAEMRHLLEYAELNDARIERMWPQRQRIVWVRPTSSTSIIHGCQTGHRNTGRS